MWKNVIFCNTVLMAWIASDELVGILDLEVPSIGYAWAQIADDAPWRMVKLA